MRKQNMQALRALNVRICSHTSQVFREVQVLQQGFPSPPLILVLSGNSPSIRRDTGLEHVTHHQVLLVVLPKRLWGPSHHLLLGDAAASLWFLGRWPLLSASAASPAAPLWSLQLSHSKAMPGSFLCLSSSAWS